MTCYDIVQLFGKSSEGRNFWGREQRPGPATWVECSTGTLPRLALSPLSPERPNISRAARAFHSNASSNEFQSMTTFCSCLSAFFRRSHLFLSHIASTAGSRMRVFRSTVPRSSGSAACKNCSQPQIQFPSSAMATWGENHHRA